ncbi:ADP-ribosylglycohydrolase family protein [uncultured Rothia sp.]|uniref:ADP-ribosylglycohydrolase family protein n=1 Tax=uncultured Rothia sp. TaxID=316088 RepID=UPI0032175936
MTSTFQPAPQITHPAFAQACSASLDALASADAALHQSKIPSDETWFALYQLDGLNEVLEWNNEGVAADETACIWLALLRMIRTVHSISPDGAPFALDRAIDSLTPHSCSGHIDATIMKALNQNDMQLLEKNINAEAQDGGSLVRSAMMGFLPVEDPTTVAVLTARAAALTHGHEQEIFSAVAVALLVRSLLAGVTDGQQRSEDGLLSQALEAAADWFVRLPLPQLPGHGEEIEKILRDALNSPSEVRIQDRSAPVNTAGAILKESIILAFSMLSTSEIPDSKQSTQALPTGTVRARLLATFFASIARPDQAFSASEQVEPNHPAIHSVLENFFAQVGASSLAA